MKWFKIQRNKLFNYTYKKELFKAFFAHDSLYADSRDLAKRSVSDKLLKDRS